MKEYLKGAPNSPAHWYQAALIAFREGDYVAVCTYLWRGIAANPYIAEGLTGRTVLSEHLYWHASNVHGPEWAVDYLDSAACDWTPEEIDFVDWVFNASPVLKERAEMMALPEKTAPSAVTIRVHRLPAPGVAHHFIQATPGFPAQLSFGFGRVGVAGGNVAGAARGHAVGHRLAAGGFKGAHHV